MIFLLDKPDDWRIRPDALAKELKVGRDTVYRLLKRLIDAGYIHRDLIKRNHEGKFQTGAVYIIFEESDERQEYTDKSEFERAAGEKFDDDDIPF